MFIITPAVITIILFQTGLERYSQGFASSFMKFLSMLSSIMPAILQ